jgi:hypothetical protein
MAIVALSPVEIAADIGTTISGVAAIGTFITLLTQGGKGDPSQGGAGIGTGGAATPPKPDRAWERQYTALAILAGLCAVSALTFAISLGLQGLPANSPPMNSDKVLSTRLTAECLGFLASLLGWAALVASLRDRGKARAGYQQAAADVKKAEAAHDTAQAEQATARAVQEQARARNDNAWATLGSLAVTTGFVVVLGMTFIA